MSRAPWRATALALVLLAAAAPAAQATLSIVARDSVTGEIGVAVKSRGIRVGGLSSHADWRAGAVFAQGYPNLSQMPRGLQLLREGQAPGAVIEQLTAGDSMRVWRQLSLVDARGTTAAFSGEQTYASSGEMIGGGYVVQGNSLANDRVLPAMRFAYENTTGPLADRMLAALEAGQVEGGDGLGRGSALLLISRPGYEPNPLMDPDTLDALAIELRVDFDPDPLGSMRFMLRGAHAREMSDSARKLVTIGQLDRAIQVQEAALALDPSDAEIAYDVAERYAQVGRWDEALTMLTSVLAYQPALRSYAARHPAFRSVRGSVRFQRAVRR
jgi:uncharacterized Ntn-hydrolase superfamily protein